MTTSFRRFLKETPDRMRDHDAADFRRDYRNELDRMNTSNAADEIQQAAEWVHGDWYYCAVAPGEVGGYYTRDKRKVLYHISGGQVNYTAVIGTGWDRLYQNLAGRTRRKSLSAEEILNGLIYLGRDHLAKKYLTSSDTLSPGGIDMWKRFVSIAHSKNREVGIYNERQTQYFPYSQSFGTLDKWFNDMKVWSSSHMCPYVKL